MRQTVFWLALAIAATALAALLLFGQSGPVLGMDPDDFGAAARLLVVLLLVGAVFVGRRQFHPRLWHAAAWLAVVVALVVGYEAFHGGL